MPKSKSVKLAFIGLERNLDIPEALASSQLSKSHDPELLGASHACDARIAMIAIDDAAKARPRNVFHELSEKGLPMFTRSPLNRFQGEIGRKGQMPFQIDTKFFELKALSLLG